MSEQQRIQGGRVKLRDRIVGIIFVVLGLVIYLFFYKAIASGIVSTFIMTPGGITRGVVGNWIIPARPVLIVLAMILIGIGIYQFFFGLGKQGNLFLALACVAFVFSFLIYVSAGKRLNLASLFSSALSMAVPITLASFSGILCERSGIVNIAIEGMMLMGAMVGSIVGSITKNIWLALAMAMIGGGLLALVHAWMSIKYKVNQIISGTVINIFSMGMTSYISSMYLQNIQSLNKTPRFPSVSIPLLADIPFIGPIVFYNSLFVYGMILLMIILQFALFRTRWGLRLRSVGEHPKAADTLGINVYKTQYTAVILGGLMAGFAGAYFSLGSVGRFDEGMTAGKGYIGLAAMIFGGWNPFNAMMAGILFGFADAMASSVSILGSSIPGQFINMLPYVVTMIVLAGLVGGHSTRGAVPLRRRFASGRRCFRRAGTERGKADFGAAMIMTMLQSPHTPAQLHFRTLRLDTPFQPRIDALAKTNDWYSWGGYRAPHSLWDEELEYFAIRSQAAVFDISPMVKYRIEGRDAEALCNKVTLRDVAKLSADRVHYTAWCDDGGHVLDDGTLFRLSRTRFRLCCQERHLPWLLDSAMGLDVAVEEETEAVAGLALQGPTSYAVLRDAGFAGVERLKIFDLAEFPHEGGSVTISRTGFTGDLGYELFVPAELALSLWDRLFEAGKLHGIRAIGYTALNRARIEAGLIVANADFVTAEHAVRQDRVRMPDEIGLGFMVDEKKGHFNGRRAILEARRKRALSYVLVGLEIDGNVPAEHAIVYHRKLTEVGLVSAAIWSPTAKRNIAIASLARPYGDTVVDDLWVEIYAMRELQYQKLMKRARVVPRPFIKLDRRIANPPGER